MLSLISNAIFAGNFEEAISLAQTAEVEDPFLSTHHAIALNQLGRYRETLEVVQKALGPLKDVEHIANLSAEQVYALIALGDYPKAAQVAQKVLELRFNNPWLRGDISVSLAVVLNCMGDHNGAQSIAAKAQSLKFSDETLKLRLHLEKLIAQNRLGKYGEVPSSPIIGTYLNALFLIEELYVLNAQGKRDKVIPRIDELSGLTVFQQEPNLKARLLLEKAKASVPRDSIAHLKEASKIPQINDDVSALITLEKARTYHTLKQYNKACEITQTFLDKNTIKNERLKALLYLERAKALNFLNKYDEASQLCFKALEYKSVKETPLNTEFMMEIVKAGNGMIGLGKYDEAYAATSRACEMKFLQKGPVKAALMSVQAMSLVSLGKDEVARRVLNEAMTFPGLEKDGIKGRLNSIQDVIAIKAKQELQKNKVVETLLQDFSYEKLSKEELLVTNAGIGVKCGISNGVAKKPVIYEGGYYDYDAFVKGITQNHPIFSGRIVDLNQLLRIDVKRVSIDDYSYDALKPVAVLVYGSNAPIPCEISKKHAMQLVQYKGGHFDYDTFMNALKNNGTVKEYGLIDLKHLFRVVIMKDCTYQVLKPKYVITPIKSPSCVCQISGKPTKQPVMSDGLDFYYDYDNFMKLTEENGIRKGGFVLNLSRLFRVVFKPIPLTHFKYDLLKPKVAYVDSELLKCAITGQVTKQPVTYKNTCRYFDYESFMDSLTKTGSVLDLTIINLDEIYRVIPKMISSM